MVFQGKKYQLVSSENFNEFMKTTGVDPACCKAVESLKPTVELRKNGDTYTYAVSSSYRNNELHFKPGQEVQEERIDGVKVKSVYTLEGNTLKQVQKCPGGQEVTYVREFGPDQMKAVLTANNVTCTRVYKAQ